MNGTGAIWDFAVGIGHALRPTMHRNAAADSLKALDSKLTAALYAADLQAIKLAFVVAVGAADLGSREHKAEALRIAGRAQDALSLLDD